MVVWCATTCTPLISSCALSSYVSIPLLPQIWDFLLLQFSFSTTCDKMNLGHSSQGGKEEVEGGGICAESLREQKRMTEGLEGLFSVSLGILHVLNSELLESDFEHIMVLLTRPEVARLETRGVPLLNLIVGAARLNASEVSLYLYTWVQVRKFWSVLC